MNTMTRRRPSIKAALGRVVKLMHNNFARRFGSRQLRLLLSGNVAGWVAAIGTHVNESNGNIAARHAKNRRAPNGGQQGRQH